MLIDRIDVAAGHKSNAKKAVALVTSRTATIAVESLRVGGEAIPIRNTETLVSETVTTTKSHAKNALAKQRATLAEATMESCLRALGSRRHRILAAEASECQGAKLADVTQPSAAVAASPSSATSTDVTSGEDVRDDI